MLNDEMRRLAELIYIRVVAARVGSDGCTDDRAMSDARDSIRIAKVFVAALREEQAAQQPLTSMR
jgi:hypothetical protein